jgi:hypothetical protein
MGQGVFAARDAFFWRTDTENLSFLFKIILPSKRLFIELPTRAPQPIHSNLFSFSEAAKSFHSSSRVCRLPVLPAPV